MSDRGRIHLPMYLFLRSQEDGTWAAAIVAKTDRTLRDHPSAHELIDFNILADRNAAENWAAEIMGPIDETVYVAPECRH